MDWTAEHIETLRFHFLNGARFSDIGALMGTNERSIQGVVFRLGWKKDDAMMAQRKASGGYVNRTDIDWGKPGLMEFFRELFDAGFGYRAIAKEISERFCPISRSACIGRANRLGWVRRVLLGPKQPRTPRAPRAPRPPKEKRKGFQFNQHRISPSAPGELLAFKASIKPQVPPKEDLEPVTPLPFLCVGLLDLDLKPNQHQCRYPHGEGPPFVFCGQPSDQGSSYCNFHTLFCTEYRNGFQYHAKAQAKLYATQAASGLLGTGPIVAKPQCEEDSAEQHQEPDGLDGLLGVAQDESHNSTDADGTGDVDEKSRLGEWRQIGEVASGIVERLI